MKIPESHQGMDDGSLTNRAADHARALRGFSLIEIMIVMGLLSVIVIGLMAMFNQTQRAFRLGMTQTDVLEAGRMATELLAREIEQVTPSYVDNNAPVFGAACFYTTIFNPANVSYQLLTGSGNLRTNVLEDLFFVTHENQTWTGVGYFVRTNATFAPALGYGPIGTLYRYETNTSVSQFQQNPGGFGVGYTRAIAGIGRASKVLEGVVHFRIRAFDPNGNWIQLGNTNLGTGITALPSFYLPTEPVYGFTSNAVPAYVEVEIGILEPHILERYRSIPIFLTQSNFLVNQIGHVHVFRQRVAVRAVDPSAYR